ncbi:MAG: HPr family phosphocarrier protein [Treponema sp.]|jgi:phosphocarrier protein|nr:HPr family phosphocarrier protein [Treponema sp.]
MSKAAAAEQVITISNRAGVHARPAALLVQTAKDFKSDIYLEKGNDRINGKSIMGIITLGAAYGTELKIIAEGEDAAAAVEAIVRLFESKFEEE